MILPLSFDISPLSPSPQVVAVVEQNPLQRTLKRFVSFFPFHPFLSFLSPFIVFGYVYIYEIVCVATFARREGEKGNLYLDPASRARRVFSALCGGFVALTPRGGERSCFFDIRFVCHRDDQFEQKLCKIYPAYHPLFILRRNDTK